MAQATVVKNTDNSKPGTTSRLLRWHEFGELWNCVYVRTFRVGVRCVHIETACLTRSSHMNIFYIIGVVVVVIVVAGFFGLHV
jgi:hypothetical protein